MKPLTTLSLSLHLLLIVMGLTAALVGILWAKKYRPNSPARRLSIGSQSLVIVVSTFVIYPALPVAMWFEIEIISKGDQGAQAGILGLMIALGCCALTSMLGTLLLIARSRWR
jgi:hypothetical protein